MLPQRPKGPLPKWPPILILTMVPAEVATVEKAIRETLPVAWISHPALLTVVAPQSSKQVSPADQLFRVLRSHVRLTVVDNSALLTLEGQMLNARSLEVARDRALPAQQEPKSVTGRPEVNSTVTPEIHHPAPVVDYETGATCDHDHSPESAREFDFLNTSIAVPNRLRSSPVPCHETDLSTDRAAPTCVV